MISIGSCYVYENGRNSSDSAFLLRNKENAKFLDVVPPYTQNELRRNEIELQRCFRGDNGAKKCVDRKENPNVWRHAMVLGNSILSGKDDSFVVGLPYAWIGESYEVAFNFDDERRIGTIGKVVFDKIRGPRLVVPKNQEYRDVVGLASQGGSIWGTSQSRVSSFSDPVRNLYVGTSISKGSIKKLAMFLSFLD